jgi:hypothetical protein
LFFSLHFQPFVITSLISNQNSNPRPPRHAKTPAEKRARSMPRKHGINRSANTDALHLQAQKLVQRRFAHRPGPEQLQAIILAVTGELHVTDRHGDRNRPMAGLPARVIEQLERALARERGRARSGHRSYDFNRHIAIHQALLALKGTDGNHAAKQTNKKPAR